MPQLTSQQAVEQAMVRQRAGALEEAERLYRQILNHEPEYADALHLLGALLAETGRREEAVDLIRRALRVVPTAADGWLNLGIVLFQLDRSCEAADAFARAAELKPRIDLYGNLGTALRKAGRLPEAAGAYRQMMKMRAQLKTTERSVPDPLELAACDDLLVLLHQDPANSAKDIFDDHALWNQIYAAPLAASIRPHANEPTPSRRLKVGYVSAYLCNRPIGRFLTGLFANHDREQFEIFCYSDSRMQDQMTDRLRAACTTWRDVSNMDEEHLAKQIREDRIDILIDLGLHTIGNRMLTFARKPAPVQMTYLSYAGTTGLRTIDYRISDSYLDPDESQPQCYSERTIRLRSYWCYPPPEEAPAVSVRLEPRAPATFGCFNDFSKVNPRTLSMWGDVLRAVPDSRMLLHAPVSGDRIRALAGLQVEPHRLEFFGMLSMPDYFNQYHRIDIALDPTPWCGGTTTCDALWMGVPVVSLAGHTAVSRGGLSILSQVGLADLVAHSPEQYIAVAAELARSRARLAALRMTLRDRMQKSQLMDAVGFTRDYQALLRKAWKDWCASRKL